MNKKADGRKRRGAFGAPALCYAAITNVLSFHSKRSGKVEERLPCVKGAPPQAVRDCFYNPSVLLRKPPPLTQGRLLPSPSVYQKGTCGKNSTSAFALLLDLFLVKRSFHLRLNFGVVGKKRGNILFKDLTVDVVLRDLNDQREEG